MSKNRNSPLKGKHYRVLVCLVLLSFAPTFRLGSEAIKHKAMIKEVSSLCERIDKSEFGFAASDFCDAEADFRQQPR